MTTSLGNDPTDPQDLQIEVLFYFVPDDASLSIDLRHVRASCSTIASTVLSFAPIQMIDDSTRPVIHQGKLSIQIHPEEFLSLPPPSSSDLFADELNSADTCVGFGPEFPPLTLFFISDSSVDATLISSIPLQDLVVGDHWYEYVVSPVAGSSLSRVRVRVTCLSDTISFLLPESVFPSYRLFSSDYQFSPLLRLILSFLSGNFCIGTCCLVSSHFRSVVSTMSLRRIIVRNSNSTSDFLLPPFSRIVSNTLDRYRITSASLHCHGFAFREILDHFISQCQCQYRSFLVSLELFFDRFSYIFDRDVVTFLSKETGMDSLVHFAIKGRIIDTVHDPIVSSMNGGLLLPPFPPPGGRDIVLESICSLEFYCEGDWDVGNGDEASPKPLAPNAFVVMCFKFCLNPRSICITGLDEGLLAEFMERETGGFWKGNGVMRRRTNTLASLEWTEPVTVPVSVTNRSTFCFVDGFVWEIQIEELEINEDKNKQIRVRIFSWNQSPLGLSFRIQAKLSESFTSRVTLRSTSICHLSSRSFRDMISTELLATKTEMIPITLQFKFVKEYESREEIQKENALLESSIVFPSEETIEIDINFDEEADILVSGQRESIHTVHVAGGMKWTIAFFYDPLIGVVESECFFVRLFATKNVLCCGTFSINEGKAEIQTHLFRCDGWQWKPVVRIGEDGMLHFRMKLSILQVYSPDELEKLDEEMSSKMSMAVDMRENRLNSIEGIRGLKFRMLHDEVLSATHDITCFGCEWRVSWRLWTRRPQLVVVCLVEQLFLHVYLRVNIHELGEDEDEPLKLRSGDLVFCRRLTFGFAELSFSLEVLDRMAKLEEITVDFEIKLLGLFTKKQYDEEVSRPVLLSLASNSLPLSETIRVQYRTQGRRHLLASDNITLFGPSIRFGLVIMPFGSGEHHGRVSLTFFHAIEPNDAIVCRVQIILRRMKDNEALCEEEEQKPWLDVSAPDEEGTVMMQRMGLESDDFDADDALRDQRRAFGQDQDQMILWRKMMNEEVLFQGLLPSDLNANWEVTLTATITEVNVPPLEVEEETESEGEEGEEEDNLIGFEEELLGGIDTNDEFLNDMFLFDPPPVSDDLDIDLFLSDPELRLDDDDEAVDFSTQLELLAGMGFDADEHDLVASLERNGGSVTDVVNELFLPED